MRYVPRTEPGSWPAAVMAVVVHVLLFVFLFFTVRWQTKPPSPIIAELWTQAPSVPVPAPPPPTPKPEPPPPPPKPEPKPEPPPPPVEKPAPPKPDIAIEQEKQRKQKEERERLDREKREKEKLELDRKDRDRKEKERKDFERAERDRMDKELTRELDRDREKTVKDQLAREAESVRREKEMRDLLAKQTASAGDNRARATWIDKIRAKIRGNVLVPSGISGNPEAVFDVVQLPSGEVASVRLRKSSGVRAYDESVERAILKSSPLPQPDSPDLFERELRLTFRPLE